MNDLDLHRLVFEEAYEFSEELSENDLSLNTIRREESLERLQRSFVFEPSKTRKSNADESRISLSSDEEAEDRTIDSRSVFIDNPHLVSQFLDVNNRSRQQKASEPIVPKNFVPKSGRRKKESIENDFIFGPVIHKNANIRGSVEQTDKSRESIKMKGEMKNSHNSQKVFQSYEKFDEQIPQIETTKRSTNFELVENTDDKEREKKQQLIEFLQKEIGEYRQQIRKMQRNHENEKAELDQELRQEYEKKMHQMEKSFAKKHSILVNVIEELKAELADSKKRLKETIADFQEDVRMIPEYRKTINRYEQKIKQMQKEFEEEIRIVRQTTSDKSKSKSSEQQSEINMLNKEIDSHIQKNSRLEDTLSKLNSQLVEKDEQIRKVRKDYESIKANEMNYSVQLNAHGKQYAAKCDELERALREIDSLKLRLNDATKETQNNVSKAFAYSAEVAASNHHSSLLQSEIESLKSQLQDEKERNRLNSQQKQSPQVRSPKNSQQNEGMISLGFLPKDALLKLKQQKRNQNLSYSSDSTSSEKKKRPKYRKKKSKSKHNRKHERKYSFSSSSSSSTSSTSASSLSIKEERKEESRPQSKLSQKQTQDRTIPEIINTAKELSQFPLEMLHQAIFKLTQEREIAEGTLARIGHVRTRAQLEAKVEAERRLDEIEKSVDRIKLHIKKER